MLIYGSKLVEKPGDAIGAKLVLFRSVPIREAVGIAQHRLQRERDRTGGCDERPCIAAGGKEVETACPKFNQKEFCLSDLVIYEAK